jgi:hypothetical protein
VNAVWLPPPWQASTTPRPPGPSAVVIGASLPTTAVSPAATFPSWPTRPRSGRPGAWRSRIAGRTLDGMPRWVWGLIIILVIIIWIDPNPAGAGAAVGNAIDSMITFFRSLGQAATT